MTTLYSEKIVGYDGLRISVRQKLLVLLPFSLHLNSPFQQLYYGAGSLLTYLQKEAKEVADPEELGAPPDKPLAKIKEWIPAGELRKLFQHSELSPYFS